jgi:hypothetical protein
MNAPTLLASLEDYLRPLITAEGGTMEVCGTVEDTLAQLAQGPRRWRVLLQWQREEALGSTRTAVELRFLAIIQQAVGMNIDAGADMHRERAGEPPLLARMGWVRDAIRAARWDHPEIDGKGPQLRSTQWLTDPRLPTRQISCEFSLVIGLDAITPGVIPIG